MKRDRFVLNPDSTVMILWDLIVNLVYLISFFLVPFVLLDPKRFLVSTVRWIELTFDIILFFDVIIDFFTAYRVDSEPVFDHKQVIVNYLSTYFFFDLISTAPGLFTWESIPEIYMLKLVRYVQFKRFFELVNAVLSKARSKFITCLSKNLVEGITTLIKSCLMLVLLIHVFA